MADLKATMALLERGETCAYLKADKLMGCRAPRSCRSCLEISGCMIGPSGTCVSQLDQALDPNISFDRAIDQGLVLPMASADDAQTRTTQVWQFPAGSVQYCTRTDTVCSACRSAAFWRPSYSNPDSRFCLGEDGACVCIDICEQQQTRQADCSALGIAPAPAPSRAIMMSDRSTAQSVWHAVIGALIFALVALGLLLHVRRTAESNFDGRREAQRRRQEAQRERRHARALALGVNPLSLTGWETYRRDLIDKEAAQLAGTGVGKTTVDDDASINNESTTVSGAISLQDSDSDQQREICATYIQVEDDNRETVSPASTIATTTSSTGTASVPAQPLLAPLSMVSQRPVP